MKDLYDPKMTIIERSKLLKQENLKVSLMKKFITQYEIMRWLYKSTNKKTNKKRSKSLRFEMFDGISENSMSLDSSPNEKPSPILAKNLSSPNPLNQASQTFNEKGL